MRISPWVRIGITAAAVFAIAWHVPATSLWTTFASLHRNWLWPALGSGLAMLAVRLIKWNQLLTSADLVNSMRDAARSLFGGFALGVVAPGRLGELGRCLFVPDSDRAPTLLLTVLDRALDFWALLTMGVVSLLVVIPRPVGVVAIGVWLAFVPILLGLPKIVAAVGGLPWWPQTFRTQLRTAGQLLQTIPAVRFGALSLLSTALDLLTFFFVLRALHAADFTVVLATFPWIVMAGGLPVSVSGLGAREGAAGLLLVRFAVPAAVAMDASLLYFALTALLPALVGLIPCVARRYGAQPRGPGDLATLA